MRPVIALALGLTLTAAGPAVAAPACRLVTDVRDDTAVAAGRPAPAKELVAPELDIVSADVAADTRALTVAVRVANLTLPEAALPDGSRYAVHFVAGGTTFLLAAYAVGGRTAGELFWVDFPNGVWREEYVGPARTTFDVKRDEVRVSVPLRALAPFAKIGRGTRVGKIEATTYRQQSVWPPAAHGEVRRTAVTDRASTTRTYRVGDHSCVRPGT